MTAMQEFVVPRSMPITFAMVSSFSAADGVLAFLRSAFWAVPEHENGGAGPRKKPPPRLWGI